MPLNGDSSANPPHQDMAFSDIDSVAKAIATSTVGSDRSSLEYLPLVEELATLTARFVYPSLSRYRQ